MKKLTILAVAGLVCAGVQAQKAEAATLFEIDTCISGANCAALAPGSTVDVLLNTVPTDDLSLDIENNTNGALDYLKFFYTGALPADTEFLVKPGTFTADPAGSVAGLSDIKFEFVAKTDAGYEYNLNFQFPNAAGDRFDPLEAVYFEVYAQVNVGSKNDPVYQAVALNADLFSFSLAHIISLEDCTGQTNCGGSVKLIDEDPNDPNDPNDPVPEPTALALLGLGLFGAGYARRRKQ